MKKYKLYLQNIEIGTLTETNWDMRSYGNIQFKFNYKEEIPNNSHLSDFIKHSIQASNYLKEGDEKNYSRMCEEETKYLDLINSSDWRLINGEGEKIKILCPMFHENNEITWQRDYEK
ncbi:MAG: hypothetical protein ACJATI_005611 [Halioglobus sp.]|jgi:hypothetical protein